MPAPEFATIDEAVKDLKSGKMIILVDDEDRENEGDLVCAAEKVTAETINFMAKHGRGLICMPMTRERLDELDIRQMVAHNTDRHETGFTVSIDAKEETTTGISAHDRAATIRKAIDAGAKGSDFSRPGHVFPLRAVPGGVLVRAGHTEAAVDLSRMAGLYPTGVICEIMNDDGTMARVPELFEFSKKHGLLVATIRDLIKYRKRSEKLVERVSDVHLPTKYGEFRAVTYESKVDGLCHVALVMGDVTAQAEVLVRVHSECLTGDVFGSLRCDCGDQLRAALKMVNDEGCGVVLYMQQEGRGIGLLNKMRAYELQDKGLDTVEANKKLGFEADLRDYGIGALILEDLGLKKIRLLTNNPRKIAGLSGYGLEIVETVSIKVEPNANNIKYLLTKQEKLGHELGL
ncbi:MAG: bifunctional 3,4-dihydroxy-2-butanone-4-phosphate synthase/GTP cyclohydrolase II [archaeon]|nr:bifunctional 3,4-dihydroxy-2-butanone-4-phosphate synthase/GTP cyclohydrolase II [archaeon]